MTPSHLDDAPADGWLGPLLTGSVCFDSTVPMHMTSSGLAGVLQSTFLSRALWPPAVRADLLRAAGRIKGLRELASGRFAAVIELVADEEEAVEDLRKLTMTLVELRAKPTKNRGEAECIVVCKRLGLPLVVHDEVGREWARQEKIKAFTLIDCLCAAARLGHLKPAAAWKAYERICDQGMIPLAAFAMTSQGRQAFMTRVEPLYGMHAAGTSVFAD